VIIWANDKILDWFGREILGKPISEFLPLEHWDIIYKTLRKLKKIENLKLKKDNRIYELSGFFIDTEGLMEKGRFQLIMRDITEEVRLSTIDHLTNIYNKRFINGFLLKEIERSRRLNKQFSIVICDMDDFKRINDTYGHLSGDMVIKSFSQIINKSIRTLDVTGRYGGDEFVIILPETSSEDAYRIIDRLRIEIQGTDFRVISKEKVSITASFGIATFPQDGMSSDDLIIASDERLYKAKNLGKNSISCA
jgi:diguanylate cyclase (GGDEF)-like protein